MVILNDILVSVRMPESLLLKLKKLTEKEHFMDVSEEIRSITRKNWFKFTHPELTVIEKLRKDVLNEVKNKNEKEITKRVIKELNEIKKEIKKEGDK